MTVQLDRSLRWDRAEVVAWLNADLQTNMGSCLDSISIFEVFEGKPPGLEEPLFEGGPPRSEEAQIL